MKQRYRVKGMTCSACSAGIEKTLQRLDGVKSVAVSLTEENMLVDFDEKKLTDEIICTTVNKLGYKASLFGAEKEEKPTFDRIKLRFILSIILLLPIIYLSMGGMAGLPIPDSAINYSLQLFFSTIVLGLNYKFFSSGSRAVWHRAPNMDTLVALGAAASYIYSVVTMSLILSNRTEATHLFFESAAMVVTLVTLGKWLEDKSKRRTGRELEKLSKLIPDTAIVLQDGKEITVSTAELQKGDKVVFKAGDYICVDGTILEGSAFLDKSAITGESLPVELSVSDLVSSGSIVKSGYITVEAEKTGEATLFAQIVERVRLAGASKAPVQKFADKVAGIFVPVVSVLALLTFIIWLSITKDVYKAFNFGISVTVISCPCALGLATPVAVMAATGKAASLGILYKDAEALQKSPEISCFLLDKTATITVGSPKVQRADFFIEDKALCLSVASAIEEKSNHPLAECIKSYCGKSRDVCSSYEYLTGRGAVATVSGVEYYLGNRTVVGPVQNAEKLEQEYSKEGRTAVFLATKEKIIAVFAISDYIKDDSRAAITALNEIGIRTVMVTGDNPYAAGAIAEKAGLSTFVAEVLPEEKAAKVTEFQQKGYCVGMVGDGINDSPALKTADLGIAVSTGTDIAIDSADIVLVGGSLRGLYDTVKLGKKAVSIIKGNLFWAFFYNVIAIPLAAGGLSVFGITLTPSIAAGCMSLSSLFVVLNALRITTYKPHRENEENTEKGEQKMIEKTLIVEGMMCMHCVKHVKEALEKVEGVKNVTVTLENKTAVVVCTEATNNEALIGAVTSAGYETSSII